MRDPKLDEAALERALKTLSGWSLEGAEIVRTFELDGYRAAVGFTMEVAMLAEREDHHPDVVLRYGKVEVRFTTHDSGGVTERDVSLAQRCNEIFGGRGAR